MSEDKPASKGPVTIMKGGTNSSEFERLIAAKKLEADRRRASSDADRKVASVSIAQGGAMLRELDMGTPKRNLVGVVQLVNTAGTHERFMQVDIVDGESNGQIIRTIVLVCPLCIERGLPQDQAQISIRDDHRKWYLDERTRGQVFTDPSTLQVYALAGTIVAPGPYRCSAYNCGHRSFRIDPKSDYPGVSMQPDPETLPEAVRPYAAPSMQDEADVSDTVFAAPGAPTGRVVESGVEWRAQWDVAHDGIAIATRRHMVALIEAGVPVSLRQTSATLQTDQGDHYARSEQDIAESVALELGLGTPADPRDVRLGRCRAIVHHAVPLISSLRQALYPSHSHVFDREMMEGLARRRVLITPFEREGVTPALASLLARFGQVWVPCRRNREMLLAAKLDPARVHVVPHPMEDHATLVTIGEVKRRKPIDAGSPVRLYSIGKFESRKGHDVLLEAFLRTFAPSGRDARATLALKTSKFGRVGTLTSPEDLLKAILQRPEIAERGWTLDNVNAWVKIVTGFVDDMTSWHAAGDVFVSASHGEGFDLPAFDAVQAGSRLVHVGFGGSEDFAPEGAISIPWGREPCDPHYAWGREAQWASVRWQDVGAAMARAVDERQRGAASDLSPYRKRTVGQLMRRLIEELDP